MDSILPGPIKLHSKAAEMQRNLKTSAKGQAGQAITRVASYGFAMGEENARDTSLLRLQPRVQRELSQRW